MSTIRRPVATAIRAWSEYAAGTDEAPGRVSPSASAAAVIVLAVPIVMQCPGERAMPFSMALQSSSVIVPARLRSQYFHASDPLPRTSAPHRPGSIGPAGRKTNGSPMLVAPITRPGVVLSQPPISTAPSTGWERSSSSASIASMLR
jgi:hypothetical protein